MDARTEWWRDMFASSLWQHLQLSWEHAEDADDAAARVVRALGLRAGERVLDVPAGTGRIARRLRSEGHPTVGVDATERFLAVACRAGVPVIRADMRTSVVRAGSFDAAICMWGSFGYFDEAGNRAQARALADAVAPRGRCLIDTLAADTLLPRFEPEGRWELGGTRVDERRRYDERSKRIETRWTFSRDDLRERRTTSIRLYAVAELADMLEAVGFSSFQALGDDLSPFGPSSDRLWMIATKRD